MKTLVDEIRDIAGEARIRGMYPAVTYAAKDLLGRSCLSEEDEAELFAKIADRIEREYLPRPRFEDGEPVQFGDEVELHYKSGGCGKGIIQAFHANEGPVWILSFLGNDHERLFMYDSTCDVLKRPEHDVLDADGVTIRKGDTVYPTKQTGAIRPFEVKGFNDGYVLVDYRDRNPDEEQGDWNNYLGEQLTHKEPDTMERIEEDAARWWLSR